ncbi:curlin subunit CsgB [Vibrio splendidus]|jgi:minor curlin subunit|uniref:Curlin subunit CsgB n=1 Tax=Vibrio splendidus TaxID=29497 RepID=A0A2N7F8J7_VIBSP|nr:curlin subunit CsgB [Vibrio splendidus]PMJ62908.1 curlin subunit CsgB [Vibrio splendidus]
MVIGKKSLISLTCLYLSIGSFNSAIASDLEGSFLHNINQDVVDEFNDLDLISSWDLDNYSEIDISNASDSIAIIRQNSAGVSANNKAKIKQSGNSNSAYIKQTGSNNIAFVNQDGSNNTAAIGQLGVNSEALISQDGNNNLAVIGQANFSRQSSQLSIDQKGNGNTAYLAGSGRSNLGISQDGNDFALVKASSSMRIYINQAN